MDYNRDGEVYQPSAGGFRPAAGRPPGANPRQGRPLPRTRVMPVPAQPPPPTGPPRQYDYPQ